MQGMKPAKEFRTLIANEESLNALLEVKRHLEDYLPDQSSTGGTERTVSENFSIGWQEDSDE